MDEFNNVISSSTSAGSKNNFNKEEWAKQKQEEREKAYDLIESTAKNIVTDIDKFKTYLDVQSRFEKYSVGNGLLITAQMPTATQIKDYRDWKGAIKNFDNPIIILEPGSQYTRVDGTVGTSYNPKKMYDISCTNTRYKPIAMKYADKLKVEGLLSDKPIFIKVVKDIENCEKYAKWDKKDNVLYFKASDNWKEMAKDLTSEYAKISLEARDDSELDIFKCNSVVYMISKKYDLDTSNIALKNIPSDFENMSSLEIRNELESIKGAMEEISRKIDKRLDEVSRKQKNKEHLR